MHGNDDAERPPGSADLRTGCCDARGAGAPTRDASRVQLAMPAARHRDLPVAVAGWRRAVQTSLGQLPGPALVWEQAKGLHREYLLEREKEAAFHERQAERDAAKLAAANPEAAAAPVRPYTGAPTFFDQIVTSLKTVMSGFLLSALLAIPLGIADRAERAAPRRGEPADPDLQAGVAARLAADRDAWWWRRSTTTDDPAVPKSFIISADHRHAVLAVADADQHRGGRGLDRQGPDQRRARCCAWAGCSTCASIVLPSALPMIFTGLRLSLGVGWMVLIAAEMLAQNPGLGKFVWDEFQNGSSQSLAGSWSRCSRSA